MKKIAVFILLSICFRSANAQRFFYLEENHLTRPLIQTGLEKSNQHLVTSPLASDYIIHSQVSFQKDTNSLALEIQLQDSVSSKTLYAASETCRLNGLPSDQRLLAAMALRLFIEKNMYRLVRAAKDQHGNGEMLLQKPAKDKT